MNLLITTFFIIFSFLGLQVALAEDAPRIVSSTADALSNLANSNGDELKEIAEQGLPKSYFQISEANLSRLDRTIEATSDNNYKSALQDIKSYLKNTFSTAVSAEDQPVGLRPYFRSKKGKYPKVFRERDFIVIVNNALARASQYFVKHVALQSGDQGVQTTKQQTVPDYDQMESFRILIMSQFQFAENVVRPDTSFSLELGENEKRPSLETQLNEIAGDIIKIAIEKVPFSAVETTAYTLSPSILAMTDSRKAWQEEYENKLKIFQNAQDDYEATKIKSKVSYEAYENKHKQYNNFLDAWNKTWEDVDTHISDHNKYIDDLVKYVKGSSFPFVMYVAVVYDNDIPLKEAMHSARQEAIIKTVELYKDPSSMRKCTTKREVMLGGYVQKV